MRKPVVIRKATLEEAEQVMSNLRPIDEVEVVLMTGKTPAEALKDLDISSTFVGLIDGEPAAIFGLSMMSPNIGVPWLVGTEELVTNAKSWLIYAKAWINWMNSEYESLTNIVHKKNTKAIRWLKRMGFDLLDNEVEGFPDFIQFVRYRACV